MSTNKKNKLIPKLRFPEFKNDGEWEVKRLGEVIHRNNKRNKGNFAFPVQSVSNKFGFIDQEEYFDDRILASNDKSNYYIIEKGNFAYNPSRINVGSLAYKNDDKVSIISPLYVSFFAEKKLIEDLFLFYWLGSEEFVRQMNIFITGGVRNTLGYESLIKIRIPVPSLPEQQKIAACLSSLDELIAAERQKLEQLKNHKKGLLQNLFPQEGETVPKFRFKEFEDSGEWVEKELGSFCNSLSSGKDKNVEDGEYELYGSTGIIGKAENANYEGDFILVARVGANAGLLNKVTGKFGVTDNTLVIDLIKKDIINFIYYSLENVGLKELVFGSGQPLITGGQLKSLQFLIPQDEKEQEKIADTLSSVDDLIKAQIEKIEALQLHKKGLLQGLFPNINGNDNG